MLLQKKTKKLMQSKELVEISTVLNFQNFNFQQFSMFMNDNTEYIQVFVHQKRFCQL